MEALRGLPISCVYGATEAESLCPQLRPGLAHVIRLTGGHHLDGNYAAIADSLTATVSGTT